MNHRTIIKITTVADILELNSLVKNFPTFRGTEDLIWTFATDKNSFLP